MSTNKNISKLVFKNYKPIDSALNKYYEESIDIKDELLWINQLVEGITEDAKNDKTNELLDKSYEQMNDNISNNYDLKRMLKDRTDKAVIDTDNAIQYILNKKK